MVCVSMYNIHDVPKIVFFFFLFHTSVGIKFTFPFLSRWAVTQVS